MISVLNNTWRRGTLGWGTAAEVWQERRISDVDRGALREEVMDKAARNLPSAGSVRWACRTGRAPGDRTDP
jgi:hypothetical protein